MTPGQPLLLSQGDVVTITAHGTTKQARVILASANGYSLMVEFDGGLFWPGEEGGYAGTMPLLWDEAAGAYLELLNQRPVVVAHKEPS